MKKNDLCKVCSLSALCLPMGVKKLAEQIQVCEFCKRTLVATVGSFVVVEPNVVCWQLMVSVLTKGMKLCPDCGAEKNKEELEKMKAMMEIVGQTLGKK